MGMPVARRSRMNIKSFNAMKRDDRWRFTDLFGSGFPETISGHDTNVNELANTIRYLVRVNYSNYSINAVPPTLVDKLQALDVFCQHAEKLIAEILEEVCAKALVDIDTYEKQQR